MCAVRVAAWSMVVVNAPQRIPAGSRQGPSGRGPSSAVPAEYSALLPGHNGTAGSPEAAEGDSEGEDVYADYIDEDSQRAVFADRAARGKPPPVEGELPCAGV